MLSRGVWLDLVMYVAALALLVPLAVRLAQMVVRVLELGDGF